MIGINQRLFKPISELVGAIFGRIAIRSIGQVKSLLFTARFFPRRAINLVYEKS